MNAHLVRFAIALAAVSAALAAKPVLARPPAPPVIVQAQPLLAKPFRDNFEGSFTWGLFEEIVADTPACSAAGISNHGPATEYARSGAASMRVWPNKPPMNAPPSIKRVQAIAGRRVFDGHGVDGIVRYQISATIDPATGDTGEVGPEFSIQNHRPPASGVSGVSRTSTAGIQYVANNQTMLGPTPDGQPKRWQIFIPIEKAIDPMTMQADPTTDVAGWTPLSLALVLTPGITYDFVLTVDYTANRYISLSIHGGETNLTMDLSQFAIGFEQKFAGPNSGQDPFLPSLVITAEAQNKNNGCTMSNTANLTPYTYKVYYDAVQLSSPCCSPPAGDLIDAMETVNGWSTISGGGAPSPGLQSVSGCSGNGVALDYDLGTPPGAWAQLRRDFNPPLNLSVVDHLRLQFKGDNRPNTMEIGIVVNGVNYFASSRGTTSQLPWCTYSTWDLLDFRNNGQPPPGFGAVQALFISIVHSTTDDVGLTGRFIVDEIEAVNLATRATPSGAEPVAISSAAAANAAQWIAARKQAGGLYKSWQEEPEDYAWLYDQALALIVLSETDKQKAAALAAVLSGLQNSDGSWYVGYHASDNAVILTNKDIGPIAWTIHALYWFSVKTENSAALQDAKEGAAWLATQQNPDGSVSGITEWNLDAWWAFDDTGMGTSANRLRDYLMGQVWDAHMGRFKSSASNREIFLDNQTWGAAFLRAIRRDADARRALSYARLTLATSDSLGQLGGLDGAGPYSVWNEGTLQYVLERGEGSQFYWDQVASQQAADGGVPNSPDSFKGYIVWLSPWHGIAPTAWFYFAGGDGRFFSRPQTRSQIISQ